MNRLIDFRELRNRVTMRQVVELLDWSPVSKGLCYWRGPCPIHGSRADSRSLEVNMWKGLFHCHAKSCGAGGNHLDLYAAVTDQPLYQAAQDLARRLGVTVPYMEAKHRG